MGETLSAALARRTALAAQGFGASSRAATPGLRQLTGLVHSLGLLQIDSVNVFERSHYLPAFSRLGGYDRGDLDRLTAGPRMIEYWAHEASFIPVATYPLFGWRMQHYRQKFLNDEKSWAYSNGPMLRWLLDELAEKGPMAASEVEHDAKRRSGPWWGWSDVKIGLETLFRWGDVVSAGRNRFERVYGLPHHVLPEGIRSQQIGRADAVRTLVSLSAKALGVGTARDIADYYRLKQFDAVPAIRELEDSGELLPVTVEGWGARAWLHRDARLPRRMDAAAILTPFDPVVWFRERAERLYGFHYRIELYTPAAKRIYGYYVLPVLLDDRIVGRVDLKSDRQAGVLRVQSAWVEPGGGRMPRGGWGAAGSRAHGSAGGAGGAAAAADASIDPDIAPRLAAVLRQTAEWQGLPTIEVAGRGTLAPALAAELAAL